MIAIGDGQGSLQAQEITGKAISKLGLMTSHQDNHEDSTKEIDRNSYPGQIDSSASGPGDPGFPCHKGKPRVFPVASFSALTRYAVVSEAGASVYSASSLARSLYPHTDIAFLGTSSVLAQY